MNTHVYCPDQFPYVSVRYRRYPLNRKHRSTFPYSVLSTAILITTNILLWKCGTVQIFGNDYNESKPDSGGN
jgi:hypothetical protein